MGDAREALGRGSWHGARGPDAPATEAVMVDNYKSVHPGHPCSIIAVLVRKGPSGAASIGAKGPSKRGIERANNYKCVQGRAKAVLYTCNMIKGVSDESC